MLSERTAPRFRGLLYLTSAGLAVWLGWLWWRAPGEESRKSGGEARVNAQIAEKLYGQEGRLVVTRMHFDGDRDSEKLRRVLEELREEKYRPGGKVEFVELDVAADEAYALRQGAKVDEPGAHLDFHSAGMKLGQLVGTTDPKTVDLTIQRYLRAIFRKAGGDGPPETAGDEPEVGPAGS